MSIIQDIAGMSKRLPKQPSKTSVEQEVEKTLLELAHQQSSVDLIGAASFEAPAPERDKRVTVTLKPVLRSVDVETGDDVGFAVKRVVGGEVKVTLRF